MNSIDYMSILQNWPAQFAIISFFTMGFVTTYYHWWRQAFVKSANDPVWQYTVRIGLMLLGIGLGVLLNVMGYTAVRGNATMFYNLGLFLLFFLLLDERVSFLGYLVRCVALYGTVIFSQLGQYDRWQFWVSVAALALVMTGVYVFDQKIRTSARAMSVAGCAFALSYWPWLGSQVGAMTITPILRVKGVLMLTLMSWIAYRYWVTQRTLATTSDAMTEQANFDALTQARSYSLYEREAGNLLHEAQDERTPLTAVMFDIDHFKRFNDTYGHLAGDVVLTGVIETVRKTLLQYVETDYIYRVGGEEFVMLFPGMTVTQATRIVRDCGRNVGRATFMYESTEMQVTLSMGMTGVRSDDRTMVAVYKRVDEFLYQSKHAGRNAITIEGRSEMFAGKQSEAGYCFFAQPIVDVKADGNTTLIAKELLLRMRSDDGTQWVLPNTFDIDIDVQIALFNEVLAHSQCRHLGINLLPSQFTDFRVARTIAEFTRSHQDFIMTIEVTGVPELGRLPVISAIYHDAGVRLSIDNVGSENHYEAVQPLLKYFDLLKFSMQNLRRKGDVENMDARLDFWQHVATDNDCLLVVSGVETKRDAVHLLSRFGVYRQQGYLYGRPSIPNDDRV